MWFLIWCVFTVGNALLPLALALGLGAWEAWEWTLLLSGLAFSVCWWVPTQFSTRSARFSVMILLLLMCQQMSFLLAFIFFSGLNTNWSLAFLILSLHVWAIFLYVAYPHFNLLYNPFLHFWGDPGVIFGQDTLLQHPVIFCTLEWTFLCFKEFILEE